MLQRGAQRCSVSWPATLQKLQLLPTLASFTSSCRNLHISILNCAILVSMESPRSLECDHANEGVMERHQTDDRITCLLWLDDEFYDFSLISLISAQWLA